MRCVLATSNPGKVREIRALTAAVGLDIQWLGLGDLSPGLEMPEETGTTFADNALLKAQSVATQCGIAALADDSGLVVDALGGAPGVHSARFAGGGAGDSTNNLLLLEKLAGVPMDQRQAAFHCAAVLVIPETSELHTRLQLAQETQEVRRLALGSVLAYLASGRVQGIIAQEPKGAGGFGYDPLMIYPPLGRHFAELSTEEKNAISHRSQAVGAMLNWMASSLRGH